MTLHEENLLLANKLLDIKIALEDGTFIQDDILRCEVSLIDNDECVTLYLYKNTHRMIVGFIDKQNMHNYNFAVYNSNPVIEHIRDIKQFHYLPKNEKYEIDYSAELTEEWYFQNSLLYNEEVLKILTIYKVLNSVESDYTYFSFNVMYIDEVHKRIIK